MVSIFRIEEETKKETSRFSEDLYLLGYDFV
jgi:hypothetical protein